MPFWTYFLNNLKAYKQIMMKFLENIKIVIDLYTDSINVLALKIHW